MRYIIYYINISKKIEIYKYYHNSNPNFVYCLKTIKKIEKSSSNYILYILADYYKKN